LIADPSVRAVHRRGRKKIYTEDVKKALLKVGRAKTFSTQNFLSIILGQTRTNLRRFLMVYQLRPGGNFFK
ncbi:MAG: hypothetical protein D6778_06800, partial [Nitrospirae bacterium]